MDRKVENIDSTLNKLIRVKLKAKFDFAGEKIKEIIIEKYESELVNVVTDRNSKTNPSIYIEEFIERLNEFVYVKDDGSEIKLVVPDMKNFNFSGRLDIIETVMEGVAGLYIEINGEEFKAIFGKYPISVKPFDDYVPPKDRIYLVRYSKKIKSIENKLKKKFIKYPFSNTPPIKILEEAEYFVNDNIDNWIKEAIEEANKELVDSLK